MVDEQNAVQVIDLMLDGAGQQVLTGDLELFAFYFLSAHRDLFRAAHWLAETGNAEAAFFSGLLAFLRRSLRG